jgi:ABC-type multidrug transport system ATPase subunit
VPLIASEVRKRLGGRDVLAGANLRVDDDELVALFGENGAGKSTLLRIVAGIIDADAGGVTGVTRAELGYVPEAADLLPELTPRELARLVAAMKRTAPPGDELIDRLGVRGHIDQPLGSLSLGQRRRACLLAALVGTPRLLVLDEPTNGLDVDGVAMLVEVLRGKMALVATHDRPFAEAIGARCLTIVDGKVS